MNWFLFAFRSLARNKLRTTLTILGVAVATLTFVLLRTVVGAWNVGIEYSAKDRIATRHKVTFVMMLPRTYIDQIRQVPGVSEATWANWFGGKYPRHENEFFASMAVDPGTFFSVYQDMKIASDQLEAWKQDRRGAIVGDQIAKKFGWKIGDRVTLQGSIYPGLWDFNIDGIYTAGMSSVDRSSFIFHWPYLNENALVAQKDKIGWVVSRIDRPRQSAQISKTIDRIFDSRDIQTLTMSERDMNLSFMGMVSAVLNALDIVSVVIALIMALILGNTIAMGVRERNHEFGTMRAIGFEAKHLAVLILIESVALGLVGSMVGIAVAFPFINQGVGRFLEENMGSWFPYFRIDIQSGVIALIVAVVLALVAALVPMWQAYRLRVVEALRRVG